MKVSIYTDGAARGNPDGPGGYGTILQYVDGKGTLHERTYSRGYEKTTNNRMELMAVIVGLETLENNGSERSMPRSAYCRDVSIRRCRAKRCRERVSSLFGT